MSYLLIDGFDTYDNINSTSEGLQARWLSTGGYGYTSFVAGRYGGQALYILPSSNFNGSVQFALTPVFFGTYTLTTGMSYQPQTTGITQAYNVFAYFEGGPTGSNEGEGATTGICGIGINTSYQPFLWVNSITNPVATSNTVVTPGAWVFLELVLTIGVSGSATLYQDGTPTISYSGTTGTAPCDTFVLGSTNFYISPGYFDDIYVTNTAVRVGERRVETLAVKADESITWSSTGASNWSQINSVPVQTNTYVDTQTVGDIDLYNIKPLVGNPTAISAVQVHLIADKQDSGTRVITPLIQSGSTQVAGSNAALTNSYQHYVSIYPVDPNTNAVWTVSGVDNCLIGQLLSQ
jgi:hypothetical protein